MGRYAKNGKLIWLDTESASPYNAAEERDLNYIGARIAEARTARGLSLSEFSELLKVYGVDLSRTAINKWEVGDAAPNAYQLLAVASALGLEDDLTYFMSRKASLNPEGQKKLADYKSDLIATGLYKPAEIRQHGIPYVWKNISDLRVSAGTGALLDEESFQKVRVPASMVPHGSDFGVYISGDSMEPVYQNGQLVWVHRCEKLRPGEVGIFLYDGNGYIKSYDEQEPTEAQRDAYTDSDGNLHMQPVLISFNESYAPIVVSAEAGFQIVGKVL